jgi:hypothetical protein
MRSKFVLLVVSGCAAVVVTAAMAQVLSVPSDPKAATSPPQTGHRVADPANGPIVPPAKAEDRAPDAAMVDAAMVSGTVTVVGSADSETGVPPVSNLPPGSLPRAPAGSVWRTQTMPVLEYRAQPPVARLRTVAVFADASGQQAVNELVEKLAKTEDKSDREKVQQSLRVVLKEQFEARLKTNEKEIEQLEAEVKRLRGQLELRRKRQDEIVDFRLTQLVREAQGLGWGTEPPRAGAAFRATPDGGYSGTPNFHGPRPPQPVPELPVVRP